MHSEIGHVFFVMAAKKEMKAIYAQYICIGIYLMEKLLPSKVRENVATGLCLRNVNFEFVCVHT